MLVGWELRDVTREMIEPLKRWNLGQVNHHWQDRWFITTQGSVCNFLPASKKLVCDQH